MTWTTADRHDGYKVLLHEGSRDLNFLIANCSPINITNTSKLSQTTSALNVNQLGSYVIVAYNSAGNSVYSNVIEEQTVPKTPQLKTPDISQPGKVTLTWSDNHGVNTFIIYREQASSGSPEVTGTLIATVNGSTMKYTDSGFPTYSGTTYGYAIVPEGGGGVGAIGTR